MSSTSVFSSLFPSLAIYGALRLNKDKVAEARKKAIQGIYGIKIEAVHFTGKAVGDEKGFSWRFLIHDPKNGTTGKQLFNMSVVKDKVEGENFFNPGQAWLRMNEGIGKSQMCSMNVGPDGKDYVYSWVVEKTEKAEKAKVCLIEFECLFTLIYFNLL